MIEKYPIIKPYCDLLSSKDARTVLVIINGLQSLFRVAESVNGLANFCMMLEEIGAVDKLEALQNHENTDIYEKSYAMIEQYFTEDTDEQQDLAPKAVNGALEFNSENGGNNGGQFSF
jgi:importin subunit alpha-1/8